MLALAQSFCNWPSHCIGLSFLLPQSAVHYSQGHYSQALIWYVLLYTLNVNDGREKQPIHGSRGSFSQSKICMKEIGTEVGWRGCAKVHALLFPSICPKSDPNYSILFAPCVKSSGRYGPPGQMQLLLSVRGLLASQALSPERYMGMDLLR